MNTKPCTKKKTFSAVWLSVGVEGNVKERERLNKEAKEEESKKGKRQVEGDRRRV